jgi:hypothetical protein
MLRPCRLGLNLSAALAATLGKRLLERRAALPELVRALVSRPVTCAEFDSVGVPPEIVRSTGADGTIWRQNTIEQWIQRAVDEQRAGRHLLLCGQMPAGEILAAPSAELLDGIAAFLLHCSPEVRRKRLIDRGEDPEMLQAQVAFGEWFLAHLTNPAHMPEVIVVRGATRVRWDRWQHWTAGDPGWRLTLSACCLRSLDGEGRYSISIRPEAPESVGVSCARRWALSVLVRKATSDPRPEVRR